MFKRYKHWGKFNPYGYFMVNMFVFCIFMYLYGVFGLKQDPAGTMLVVFLGIWMMCGSCMAMLYRLSRLDDWGHDSPYTYNAIRSMKHRAESVIDYIPKNPTWQDIIQLTNDYKKGDNDITVEYAYCLIIWAQYNRAGDRSLCREAKEYIRKYPETWNVVNHV